MNLIEQQNILRGLADDALKGEMGGGSVPPYLVLAEVNRRKSARERYEAANAKYRANQPTVAEELMGQKMPSGIDAAMPGGGMPMGGMMQGGGGMPTAGIDAAMPQPQQQAFANGGMVGYAEGGPVGYADGGPVDLIEAYNQRLSGGFDEDRKMAQKMALMNIGAQIMAGRSRNTLSNVGTGLSAALPSYQQSMERLNTQEMQAMRDQIDLARQMEQDRLAQANSERDARLDELRIGAAEREAEYAGLPGYRPATAEEKAAYGLPPDAPAQMGPEGLSLIPNAEKYAKTSAADQRRSESNVTATDVITTAAGIARDLAGNPGNVGLFGMTAGVHPESDAAELRRQIGVLTANASIENVMAMRQESPTGASLGNISNADIVTLAAAAGALDPNAKQEDFQRALDNYERTLLRIVHGAEAGDREFAETREGFEPPPPTEPAPTVIDPDTESILDLYGVPR